MTRRPRGIVCYDGECTICTGLVTRWGHRMRRAGFRLAPLQAPEIQRRLGLTGIPDEMKLITPQGQVIGGADAVVAIAEATPSSKIIHSFRDARMKSLQSAKSDEPQRSKSCVDGTKFQMKYVLGTFGSSC